MTLVRHTVWLTLLIAAGTAVILMPTPETESFQLIDTLHQKVVNADHRFGLESELFRRAHSRSIAQAAAAQPTNDKSLDVVARPGLPDGIEGRVRMFASKELATLPRRDSTMRLVVAVVLDTGWAVGDVPAMNMAGHTWSLDAFPPGTVAPNTCVTVMRVHNPTLFGAGYHPNSLGTNWWPQPVGACWWYAAYGTPGRSVAAWLDGTHYAPIMEDREAGGYDWRPWIITGRLTTLSSAGSVDWIGRDPSRFAMVSCATGSDAACNSLMLANIEQLYADASNTLLTRDWIGRRRNYSVRPNFNAAALLSRLQTELGVAEFERLWKSDQPLSDAFNEIRGGSLTGWIRSQTQTIVPPLVDRPLPGRMTLVLYMFAVTLMIWGAARSVDRRSGFR